MSTSSKSTSIAFLLWFFFGITGVYRMYLGKVGSGLAMLALTIVAVMASGFRELLILVLGVFWLVDAFRISGMAQEAA